MVVSWSTGDRPDESFVDYWLAANSSAVVRVAGTRKAFVDGGVARRVQYLHRAILNKLQPGSRYRKYIYIYSSILLYNVRIHAHY